MPKPLLPAGCYDLLPPHARRETDIAAKLIGVFESFGYEQVMPPMLEYTESMLAGRGNALSTQIFRVMDPGAHKVMGFRADMTMQIARIAGTRLLAAPRPLRLSYSGTILRMQGDALSGSRQLRQTGIELIGSASAQADAEVIAVAVEALKTVGFQDIIVDLNLPGLVGVLLAEECLDNETLKEILDAIAHKDGAALKAHKLTHEGVLTALLKHIGAAAEMLPSLQKLALPEAAQALLAHAAAVLSLLNTTQVRFTLDATESRGFEYYTGISFSFFTPGVTQELGRGGHYRTEREDGSDEASGFTLYVDNLRQVLPALAHAPRVWVKDTLTSAKAAELRTLGYVTVQALPGVDVAAHTQAIDFILENGVLTAIR